MKRTAILLQHVTKWYYLHHEKPTLVEKIVANNTERFCAINDISLTIGRGETVGVTGPNGSGKTTLLKLIAGITTPSSGTITHFGSVVSLIDVSAGFHPDLSGYDNIYVNGLMLGMSRKNITRRLSSIIRSSGIRQFIDTPLFTYSEGMKFRLGFSIAVAARADVLVLDEGFAVADATFQTYIHQHLRALQKRGVTLVMASHNQRLLKTFCSTILTLKEGKIIRSARR